MWEESGVAYGKNGLVREKSHETKTMRVIYRQGGVCVSFWGGKLG